MQFQLSYRGANGHGARRSAFIRRFLLGLLLTWFVGPRPVDAGLLTVHTPNGRFGDPVSVFDSGPAGSLTGPNWKASADIGSGTFRSFAELDSSNSTLSGFPFANTSISVPYAFTNTTSVTHIYPFGSLRMTVNASYLQLAGFNGSIGNRIASNLLLTHPDGRAFAAVQHGASATIAPDGSKTQLPDTLTISESGGGIVLVHGADSSGINATLFMPQFMVDPGETWSFGAALDVVATASGVGNQATTDAFHTAQLALTLPLGVSLDDYRVSATVPLSWVSTTSHAVPEPASLAIWCLGVVGVAVVVSRRRGSRFLTREPARRES